MLQLYDRSPKRSVASGKLLSTSRCGPSHGPIRHNPATMKKLFANPYLLLILTVLFWSGNMVIGRGARGDIPPLAFAFWRWAIAFALILPLALPHLKAQWPLLKKGWKPLMVLGLLGVGGYNTFAYIALQDTSATNAALLNSFVPIATISTSMSAISGCWLPCSTGPSTPLPWPGARPAYTRC
jgi:EamA-like transporter family